MEEKFEQYLNETREDFVKAVNELQWNTKFRTKCENLLIAFDQMKQSLRQPDVSGRSEQLVNFLLHLNDKDLINDHDFDYEKEAKKYLKKNQLIATKTPLLGMCCYKPFFFTNQNNNGNSNN